MKSPAHPGHPRAPSGRKRVLIAQPSLEAVSGGNGVAAWAIEALKAEHRLVVLTWRRPALEEINRVWGTDLAPDDFHCRVLPASTLRMMTVPPFQLALLRDAYLMRRARRLAPQFDLVISTADEHDLGGHGLQYVHYPRFSSFRPGIDLRALYHWPLAVRLYRSAVLRLSGTSLARVRANRTLANSGWVAARYRDTHGAPAEILHPPAVGPFPAVPWEARENGVVCIGRLAPEKRLEVVIAIVERLRARGHALHLHLVGTADDRPYAATVRRLVGERAAWATLHEGLSRRELGALVARQRYGLHGMLDEHFGMAVAEMVSAGCIPFVPDGGGQREIVGNDPRLLYRGVEDGVARIAAVVDAPRLQDELRRALAPMRALFTPEHFTERFRLIVAECAR